MSSRRAIAALVVATSLLSLIGPAAARPVNAGHHKSWGMQGVSLEQYSRDSAECAQAAAEMDLSDSAPAAALRFWTRLGNGNMGPNNYADIWMSTRINPAVQWNKAATIMRRELDGCLMARGYVKFELTDEQYATLKTLELGSDARRAYLHGLASDGDVLAAQAVAES